MPESLPPPRPSCPGCATPLVVDDQAHVCPRCGRAFTVALIQAPTDEVYRAAPVFDIVPLRPARAPFELISLPRIEKALETFMRSRWDWRSFSRGLRGAVRDEPTPLDVTIGSALQLLRPALGLVRSTLALAGVALAFFYRDLGYVFLLGALALLITENTAARQTRDRLFAREDRLVWQRMRRGKILREESVEVRHIAAVYNEGDHVRIVLDDSNVWEVGKDLNVPRAVCRWLARRVAQEIPPTETRVIRSRAGEPPETEPAKT